MPDAGWWQWVLGRILTGMGFLVGTLEFKFALTFNVTDWLNRRDVKWKERVMLHCPHVELEWIGEGKFRVKG